VTLGQGYLGGGTKGGHSTHPSGKLFVRQELHCNLKSMFGMDSDTLIKITRIGAKRAVASTTELVVPPEVYRETVKEGKEGGFPDAFEIEQNFRERSLKVTETPRTGEVEAMVRELGMKGGEADLFRLFRAQGCRVVVSDDQEFLDLVRELGVPFVTSSALLIYVWRMGGVGRDECVKLLERLRPMVSEEEYELSVRELEGEN